MNLDPGGFIGPAALLLALAIDRWWGEPRLRLHPVVWMGNYLAWGGQFVHRVAGQGVEFTHQGQAGSQTDFKAFWLAAVVWIGGGTVVLIATLALQWAVLSVPTLLMPALGGALGPIFAGFAGGVLAAALMACLLKPMFAWAMLKSEVLAVEKALNPVHGGSLAAGRERLSWLVSRDVANLSELQVRESAIESLAENLNDSVIAPIFWFVLLGLPGAALYRFANTADAMWGYPGVYKGQNWQWAGKWAARVDDLLSYIPARITGLLLAVVSGGLDWSNLRSQARQTPSPNSGWPMAAMALGLGVCLQKPGVYALNALGRPVQAPDVPLAIIYALKALLAAIFIALVAIYFVSPLGF
ncbi:MAG: adenosylcobinamide-phosphate synthase CbiB [Rhodoferax sp.]|nr:adenosylcobinamide-phosphate synthase CbiB [Rhodoferax sp.]